MCWWVYVCVYSRCVGTHQTVWHLISTGTPVSVTHTVQGIWRTFLRRLIMSMVWTSTGTPRVLMALGPLRLDVSTHHSDVIMNSMASHITGVSIICSTVCSAAQRIHRSIGSLAFVRGIHRWPVDSSRKGPVTQKIFPIDDVTMNTSKHHR